MLESRSLLHGRVEVVRGAERRPAPGLEVLFVGHAAVDPGSAPVLSARDLPVAMRSALEDLGYRDLDGRLAAGRGPRGLAHLPLVVHSTSDLDGLLPGWRAARAARPHHPGGERPWLPFAVEDFFLAGGARAWVVLVPEEEGGPGVVPRGRLDRVAPCAELRGLHVLRTLRDVALVCLPDLERVSLSPELVLEVPEPALALEARFLPCSLDPDVPRAIARAFDAPARHESFGEVVARAARVLDDARRDVQLIVAAPLTAGAPGEDPGVDAAAVAHISAALADEELPPGAPRDRLCWIAPHLRGPRYALGSPAGLVAGELARSARERGVWRSVAGRRLVADARPVARIDGARRVELREAFDIGVLLDERGHLVLDDERSASRRFEHSAEVQRLFGQLLRDLERMGERLVFDLEQDDVRPLMALEAYLDGLTEAGALDAAAAGGPYRLERVPEAHGRLAYEIALAFAAPVDRITLRLAIGRGPAALEVLDA